MISHDPGHSDTLSLRDDMVEGFATDIGGRTSHTAILAQGLEIPAVVGLKEVTSHIQPGDLVIVDGNEGLVIINPTLATLENYRKVREIQMAEMRDLEKYKDLAAQTLDGRRVELAANIESQEEIRTALSHGAEGIGLYRTEFFYLNRRELPIGGRAVIKITRQPSPARCCPMRSFYAPWIWAGDKANIRSASYRHDARAKSLPRTARHPVVLALSGHF